MTNQLPSDRTKPTPAPGFKWRLLAACLFMGLVLTYTAGVVLGRIPADRKIDAPNLAIIAIALLGGALLVWPEVFRGLEFFELPGGFRLKLRKLEERQAEQQDRLSDMELILPLLLPEPEQRLLVQLAESGGDTVEGGHDLRTQLRHLRESKLIERRGDQRIASLTGGATHNLSDVVRLTELGRRWVERIQSFRREIDREAAQEPEQRGDADRAVPG